MFDPVNGYVYVADYDSDSMDVINGSSNSVETSFAIGAGPGNVPNAIGYDSADGDIFVANWGSGNVSIVNASSNSVIATVAAGGWPYSIAIDNLTDLVYVSNQVNDTVTVISGDPGIASYVDVGSRSSTLGFDDASGNVYAVSGASNSVTVLRPAASGLYNGTFTESGVPTKTLSKDGWTVVLDGTAEHSTGPNIVFGGLTNGTYPALVTGPSGFEMTGSGLVTVRGPTAVGVMATRGKTVTLTFSEKGLPKTAGVVQGWCVAVDDAPVCSTTGSAKLRNLTEGTYSYSVQSPLLGQNITQKIGATVTYGASGTVTLTKSASVHLTFAYRYAVTFTESGLTGGSWSVTVRGVTVTKPYDEAIVLSETNGTYGYKVGAISGYTKSGSPTKAMVDGTGVTVAVAFIVRK